MECLGTDGLGTLCLGTSRRASACLGHPFRKRGGCSLVGCGMFGLVVACSAMASSGPPFPSGSRGSLRSLWSGLLGLVQSGYAKPRPSAP